MLQKQHVKLLKLLSSKPQVFTSQQLADFFNISTKTILKYAHEINSILNNKDIAYLKFLPSKGIQLHIIDDKAFIFLLNSIEEMEILPQNQEERIVYISRFLLTTNAFNPHKLARKLSISESTLNKDLKQLRELLAKHELILESSIRYGYKITGNEKNIRKFYASLIEKQIHLNNDDFNIIRNKILIPLLNENKINISDILLENLVIHLFIAIQRVKSNNTIVYSINNPADFLSQISTSLNEKLNSYFGLELPVPELQYLYIHIIGKQELKETFLKDTKSNTVEDICYVQVNNILKRIYDIKGIDLFTDKELKANLLLHLVPFNERFSHGIQIKNPILESVKENYPLPYELAIVGLQSFIQNDNTKISDDEISFFALHFVLALERQKQVKPKFNIIVVCATGKTTSELLTYQIQSELTEYEITIFICEAYKLNNEIINSDQFDFILSNVPLNSNFSIPVYKINTILSNSDIRYLKDIFEAKIERNTLSVLNKDLFFIDIAASNYKQALEILVNEIAQKIDLPDTFLQSVLKRESFSPTDISNFVAIPHPNEVQTKETFVAVAILKNEIFWNSKMVQIVILISPSADSGIHLKPFYKWLTSFIKDDNKIQKLITYKKFYDLF